MSECCGARCETLSKIVLRVVSQVWRLYKHWRQVGSMQAKAPRSRLLCLPRFSQELRNPVSPFLDVEIRDNETSYQAFFGPYKPEAEVEQHWRQDVAKYTRPKLKDGQITARVEKETGVGEAFPSPSPHAICPPQGPASPRSTASRHVACEQPASPKLVGEPNG